jgi:lipopolysaccharide transport system permease protein
MSSSDQLVQRAGVEPIQKPVMDPIVTIIAPPKGWIGLQLRELWEYRDLLYFWVWRNLKIRYKQTILGASWAIIQPFFTMVVFSIFFGKLAGISSEGVPYPIFTYCALIPWTYFANSVSLASNSLVDQENVITKIYFPRLFAPLASTLTGLVDLAIAFAILVLMMLFYGIAPTNSIWTLPFFILLAVLSALAVGLWLSALNVEYRDVRHAVPFLMQFWLFVTPIAYSSRLVPEEWRALYGLNPMVGVVEGFRWALMGQAQPNIQLIMASTVTVTIILVGGLYYFRRMERTFADTI